MVPEFDPMPALIIISALVLVVLEIWRRGLSAHLPRAGHALVVVAGAAAMIAPFAYQLPIDSARLDASGAGDPVAHAALLDATVRAGLERLVAAAGRQSPWRASEGEPRCWSVDRTVSRTRATCTTGDTT